MTQNRKYLRKVLAQCFIGDRPFLFKIKKIFRWVHTKSTSAPNQNFDQHTPSDKMIISSVEVRISLTRCLGCLLTIWEQDQITKKAWNKWRVLSALLLIGTKYLILTTRKLIHTFWGAKDHLLYMIMRKLRGCNMFRICMKLMSRHTRDSRTTATK